MKTVLLLILLPLFAGNASAATRWSEPDSTQQRIPDSQPDHADPLPNEREKRLLQDVQRWRDLTPKERRRAREHFRQRPQRPGN